MTTFEQILEATVKAYYDARKNKRNTHSQLQFECNMEENLYQLAQEIYARTYKVEPSSCFIILHPVKREVFAASFRDRVVHHLVFNSISHLFEQTLIADCYSCRKGKGTLYGIRRLQSHIRSCSQNYTRDTYILKLDIQGYFMNINRDHLFNIVQSTINKFSERTAPCTRKWKDRINLDIVLPLLREIIYTDPTQECVFKSPQYLWDNLPKNKSLFGTPAGYGLPIGNLTSQLFSNIYLTGFDNFCKHTLQLKHYGRYVDDFYVVHNDKNYLKQLVEVFKSELKNNYQLTLHPKKIYLQNINQGVTFLGATIKGKTVSPGQRTRRGINKVIAQYNFNNNQSIAQLKKFTQQANSYIGGVVHIKSYLFRKQCIAKIKPKENHIITYNTTKYHKITTQHKKQTPPNYSLEYIFSHGIE